MVDKVSATNGAMNRKKPISQLQQLRKIQYQPVSASTDQVNVSSQSGHLSRQGPVIEELQLEKVIGTSSKGSNSLQVNPVNGDVCYMAGSRLVIYSPKDAKQIKFLPSRTQRPFQCVRFSQDGKYLAAGESAFRAPQVVIWEITYEDVVEQISRRQSIARRQTEIKSLDVSQNQQMRSQSETLLQDSVTMVKRAISYTEVGHVQGHKYGIEQVLFAPNNEFIITLGDPNDRGLFVWDWRKEKKISQNLLSKPALHVEISPKQDFFVTCGFQHLKLWHLNEETGMPDVRKPNQKSPPIIQAQSVDLAKVKLQIFVGIAIEWPKIYVLASDGHIYVFDKKGKLIKWMNIKVPRAFGCSASDGKLYCACSDGIIRVFATESLQHLLSLSKPPPLGSTNLQAGNSRIRIQQNKTNKFADVIAVQIDGVGKRAVALYSDRMMFVWDVAELKAVTVLRSMYSHSGPIHDIQVVDNAHPLGLNSKPTSHLRCEREDNLTKFVTCSSDRTIRFWNFIDQTNLPSHKQYQEIYQCLAKNAYSKDMSQMIFIVSAMRESSEASSPGQKPKTPYDHFKAGPLERSEDGQLIDVKDQSGINLNEMVDSIRCIRVSPDGSELASGDEVGNIRIHSLKTPEFAQTRYLESHDSEVISLAYSDAIPAQNVDGNRYMLASGGRDRQVLLYDSDMNYEVFMNLDHHSSTITSLAFNDAEGSGIELISSSADKSLVSKRFDNARFQEYDGALDQAGLDEDDPLFKDNKTQMCKDKVMSLDVATSAQYAVSGHDKSLCLWRLPTFERVWEKRVGAGMLEKDIAVGASKQSQAGVNQVQLRVLIDRYASVVVSSSTSKRVTIYEAASGKPLCRAQPGQITTAMCFTNNMRHLITTSDNGIIFIWRMPELLAQQLQQIKNESQRLEAAIERTPSIIEEEDENDDLGDTKESPIKEIDEEKVEADDINLEEAVEKKQDESSERTTEVEQEPDEQNQDSTQVRQKKQEVAEVLDMVNNAANFAHEVYRRETPKIKKRQDAPMDDTAQDGNGSQPHAAEADTPVQEESKELKQEFDEQEVCDQTLDEVDNPTDRNTLEVAGGEQEIIENDPDADRALLRKLEAINYQKRFINYNDEDSDMRFRRSSELLGRRSITSKMKMRRSQAYVPELDNVQKSNDQSAEQSFFNMKSPRSNAVILDRSQFQFDAESTKKPQDPVTDIVDDQKDILNAKKQGSNNSEQPAANSIIAAAANKGPLQVEDFRQTLKQHNLEAHKSFQGQRQAWGEQPSIASPGRRSSNKQNMFAKPADAKPAHVTTLQSQQIPQSNQMKSQNQLVTRPTHANTPAPAVMTDQERKRSPIKRFADKIFGRSPDKKRVGAVMQMPTAERMSQPQQPNVGKYQINNDNNIMSPLSSQARIMPRHFSTNQIQAQGVVQHQQPQQVKSPQKLTQSQHTSVSVPFPGSNPNLPLQQQHQKQMEQQQNQFKPMFMPQGKRPNSVLDQQSAQNRLLVNQQMSEPVSGRNQQKANEMSPNVTPVIKTSGPATQLMPDSVPPKSQSEIIPSERLLENNIAEEQRFNQSLQAEIDVIHRALGRINRLTSLQKQQQEQMQKSQKAKIDEQQMTKRPSDLTQEGSDEVPPKLSLVDLDQSNMQSMRVHDKVQAMLYKTMNQWNTMIGDLQTTTNVDMQQLSMSFTGKSDMLQKLDKNNTASQPNTQRSQLQESNMLAGSQFSRGKYNLQSKVSNLCTATIQEDTRDLLDKYSQLLFESFQSKLAAANTQQQQQNKDT